MQQPVSFLTALLDLTSPCSSLISSAILLPGPSSYTGALKFLEQARHTPLQGLCIAVILFSFLFFFFKIFDIFIELFTILLQFFMFWFLSTMYM